MDHCENCGGEYERLLSEGADGSEADDHHQRDYDEDSTTRQQRPVQNGQKVAYGLGHIFNDITATIWFSYTLVFMQEVVGIPPTMAGFLLFFG